MRPCNSALAIFEADLIVIALQFYTPEVIYLSNNHHNGSLTLRRTRKGPGSSFVTRVTTRFRSRYSASYPIPYVFAVPSPPSGDSRGRLSGPRRRLGEDCQALGECGLPPELGNTGTLLRFTTSGVAHPVGRMIDNARRPLATTRTSRDFQLLRQEVAAGAPRESINFCDRIEDSGRHRVACEA